MNAELRHKNVSAYRFKDLEDEEFKKWCFDNSIEAWWSGASGGGLYLKSQTGIIEVGGDMQWATRNWFVWDGETVEAYSDAEFNKKFVLKE